MGGEPRGPSGVTAAPRPRVHRPRRVEPVCSGLQAQILHCYRARLQEVLLCADLVRAYQHCVSSAHKVRGASPGLGRGVGGPVGTKSARLGQARPWPQGCPRPDVWAVGEEARCGAGLWLWAAPRGRQSAQAAEGSVRPGGPGLGVEVGCGGPGLTLRPCLDPPGRPPGPRELRAAWGAPGRGRCPWVPLGLGQLQPCHPCC